MLPFVAFSMLLSLSPRLPWPHTLCPLVLKKFGTYYQKAISLACLKTSYENNGDGGGRPSDSFHSKEKQK